MIKQMESVVKLLVAICQMRSPIISITRSQSQSRQNNFWVGVFISESHIKQASVLNRKIVSKSKTRLALIRLESDKKWWPLSLCLLACQKVANERSDVSREGRPRQHWRPQAKWWWRLLRKSKQGTGKGAAPHCRISNETAFQDRAASCSQTL